MRTKRWITSGRGVAALVCSILLALAPSASPAQQPQFRTTVELVQLQVAVQGEDGGFVPGLGPEEFVVEINGRERPVQVAYEVDLRRPERAGVAAIDAGARQERQPLPVAARRHWLLFFDLSFTSRRGVLQARRAALEFLDSGVHPDDLVAVATADRFGINLLSPFTSDREAVRQAVATLGLVKADDIITSGLPAEESISQALQEIASGRAGDDGGIGSALDAAEFREYVANVANYMEQMRAFGQMLQAIQGRKHVVMFSRGFDDRALTGQTLGQLAAGAEARAQSPLAFANDPEQMYGAAEVRDGLQQMIEMFLGADAVIHAIDPTGLRDAGVHDASRQLSKVANSLGGAGGDLTSNDARTGHQALIALADGTGGTVDWNINDLTVPLRQIAEATSTYYMIGYRRLPEDPPTVAIRVRVKRPGVRVVGAPARLTPPPEYRRMNEAQRQLQLAEFLADTVDRRAFDFDVQVVPLPGAQDLGRALVLLQVPGTELERLAAARGDQEVKLEIGGFVLDERDRVVATLRRGVGVPLGPMRERGPLERQFFRYTGQVQVPPGPYRLRMLLRDADVGWLSSRTTHLYVPEPTAGMWLARPLILAGVGAQLQQPPAEFDPLVVGDRQVVPQASPRLRPGQAFRLLLVAYHVPRHPVSGEVLAGVVLEIEDLEGAVHRLRDFRIVGTTHDDRSDAMQLLIEAQLPADTRPGDARLWARLVDRVEGARVEEQTTIFVQP